MKLTQSILKLLAIAATAFFLGCGGNGSGLYCCTYESRHSACGGGSWTDWTAQTYQFNMDDYLESWTPERVCDKFSGSDTECSATCCIYTEDRNNTLSSGACP